ncbi:MAG: M4 family metallopeptidase [Pseudomonadota bacterium]|nr:M4 family metallopeptidase [Pseudomonadota bacterium]
MNSRLGLLSLILAFGLPACATEGGGPADAPVFGQGSEDELALAEDLSYAALLDAAESPAIGKGITEVRTLKVHVDPTAMAHTKVQQLVGGVPVWGGEAIVHLSPTGAVAGFTDSLLAQVVVDSTPDFTADEAVDLAVAAWPTGWSTLTDEPIADLWVIRQDGADHLAWRVQLEAVSYGPDDTMPVYFVDAHDGSVVWSYDNFQTATCSGATNFYGTVSLDCYTDGTNYYLEDSVNLLGTYTWNNTTSGLYYVSSTSTTMLGSSAVYTNANEAHYVSQKVHDYYSVTHGRNGIDGAGGPAYITSHGYNFITSTTSYSTNYVNASWSPTNLYMTYGDGDGVNAGSLTTLDIGGHEFTHGVTQYEANLTYSGEPGHLNEAISDIFGAMVERSMLGESTDTWDIGEQTWTPASAGDALRYMADPAADGVSRDYYTSSIGSVDVHYGSGVANLAFYLMSEGGSHPRGKSTTVVTAIGADDAADIWYLALSSYMTSSTSFSGARDATLSAAAALYGTSSQQYTSVGDAWTAVGVGVAPSCTSATYTGSLARAGKSAYQPASSGTSVTVTGQTVSLSGPATANFDLYLQKKSGRTWSNVATSTASASTEAITYTGTSGTYRTQVYATSGSGSYTVTWCK